MTDPRRRARVDELTEEIRATVVRRRQAGGYPEGLEERLDAFGTNIDRARRGVFGEPVSQALSSARRVVAAPAGSAGRASRRSGVAAGRARWARRVRRLASLERRSGASAQATVVAEMDRLRDAMVAGARQTDAVVSDLTELLSALSGRVRELEAHVRRTGEVTVSSLSGAPLRVLFLVPRYGTEVAGGIEQHCRRFATALVAAGHDVEVLTTTAVHTHDWSGSLPPGRQVTDGVVVHRLRAVPRVDQDAFAASSARVLWSGEVPTLAEQQAWLNAQGPEVPDLVGWLEERAGDYDVVVHFGYLFSTTWAALEATAARTATVVHAAAHEEPALWLPVFTPVLESPTVYAWSSPEERDLLHRRGVARPGRVIGVGVDLDAPGDGERFRARRLGGRPYVLYVGRIEAGKGTDELSDFFVAYKDRHPGPLALVLMGESSGPPAAAPGAHPDIVHTGFLDDDERRDAMAGAIALVQPSFFESFSMVLSEAWAQGRPVLVQGRTDVLVGRVNRSGGGLAYRGYAEFEAALELLVERPQVADELGQAGRAAISDSERWDDVMGRYVELLRLACRVGAFDKD